MNKQEIMRDIERQYGAFPTTNQLRQYIRCRHAHIGELMEGIEPLIQGKSRRYFAGDVAARLVQEQRR